MNIKLWTTLLNCHNAIVTWRLSTFRLINTTLNIIDIQGRSPHIISFLCKYVLYLNFIPRINIWSIGFIDELKILSEMYYKYQHNQIYQLIQWCI